MHRYLFILLLLPVLAIAEDWDKRYDELCKLDNFCVRLKTQDGAWMKPKAEILAVMRTKEVQSEIHAAALKNGVDPVAIAAAIVAENSMNVTKTDTAQTWLAKNLGITSIGTKKFSFGMGQINIEAAMEAERHSAELEKRAVRGADEMTQEIADPLGSVRVAAQILRKVQDDYKAQGFDISKDVGILTTLYNLGQSEQRAKAAKKAGKQPQMNYFGTFATRYASEVKSAVGPAPNAAPSMPVVASVNVPQSGVVSVQTAGDAVVAEKTALKPIKVREVAATKPVTNSNASQRAVASVPMVQSETVSTTLALVGAPQLCATSDEDRYDESKTRTASYGAPTGVLQQGQSFHEVSRTLDCNSVVWKLVESDTGASGWVKEAVLEGVRSKKYGPAKNCDAELKAAATCASSVTTALGEKAISSDSRTMVFAGPVGPKIRDGDSKVVTFKREDFQCRDRDKKREDPQNMGFLQRRQLSLSDVAKQMDQYRQRNSQPPSLANGGIISVNNNGQPMYYNARTMQIMQTGPNGQPIIPPQTPTTPQNTPAELREVAAANIKFLDQQAGVLAKAVKLPIQELTGPSNPYAKIASWLAMKRMEASNCFVRTSSESGSSASCKIRPLTDEVKAAFENVKYEKVPDVDQANEAANSIQMAEMLSRTDSSGMSPLDNIEGTPYLNYLPGETELANKSVAEIRAALAACQAGLAELKKNAQPQVPKIASGLPQQTTITSGNVIMNFGGGMGGMGFMNGGGYYGNGGGTRGRYASPFGELGGYGNYETDSEPFFRAAQVATDDQIKDNAAEFISLGKFCHSRLNLLKDSKGDGATIQCTTAPDYMTISDGQFARAVVAKTYTKNPQALIDAVEETVPLFLKPDTVKDILGEANFKPKAIAAQSSRRQMEEESEDPRGAANYCPNRTAEKIEDLLKDNPCVKRVYVPTRYLSNKLGPADPRVVYRQFEQDDRYAVEVGSVTCEK